jgi:hypothetical protein
LDPFRIAMKLKGKEKTDWTIIRHEKEDPNDPNSAMIEVEEEHGDKKTCFKKERVLYE